MADGAIYMQFLRILGDQISCKWFCSQSWTSLACTHHLSHTFWVIDIFVAFNFEVLWIGLRLRENLEETVGFYMVFTGFLPSNIRLSGFFQGPS